MEAKKPAHRGYRRELRIPGDGDRQFRAIMIAIPG
jgi:hypothetical protein